MATETPERTKRARRRVAAEVAVTLLEVIQSQDHPLELLEDEDVSITMPRRLGLSEVVRRQITRYRTEAKRGKRVTDAELGDLIQLVLKRPDAEEIFFEAGEQLGGSEYGPWRRRLPRMVAAWLVRRRTRRRGRALFGRGALRIREGELNVLDTGLPLARYDPGGAACALVSGLCQAIARAHLGPDVLVVERACSTRNDPACQWVLVEAAMPDFLSPRDGAASEAS